MYLCINPFIALFSVTHRVETAESRSTPISKHNISRLSMAKFELKLKGEVGAMNHLCYLCLMFVMLLRMFVAALWSPAGKGLTSWALVCDV